MRSLDATFASFAPRLNCLLALHRDFLALNVHAVPPMRDDTSSTRGLGPTVACGTSGLRRLDAVLMNHLLQALKLRPYTVSAQLLSIFTRVPAKHKAKLDDSMPLVLAISSAPARRVHRSTHYSPRPGTASTHGLRNATAASALLAPAANAIST